MSDLTRGAYVFRGQHFGQLSDPYVIKTTVVPTGGTIPAGSYDISIDTVDRNGNSSFSQLVQVTVSSGTTNMIDVDIVPIWGGVGYNVFAGIAGSFPTGNFLHHFVDSPEGDIVQTGRHIIRVNSIPTSGQNPQDFPNLTEGHPFASSAWVSTIPAAPSNFFLNLGQQENSSAAFFFSDYKGIVAQFQTVGTGGPAPSGGQTELNIAFNGDSAQLIVAPFTPTKELDIFVNNTFIASFQATQMSVLQNLIVASGRILEVQGEDGSITQGGFGFFRRSATFLTNIQTDADGHVVGSSSVTIQYWGW